MYTDNTPEGANLIAGAIAGLDYKVVLVKDKAYILKPPTIHRIAGASYWLTEMGDAKTLRDLLATLDKAENLAKALSWFIQGDDALAEELAEGSLPEIIDALEVAFSLIDAANFIKLSALVRSAKLLIVKPNT